MFRSVAEDDATAAIELATAVVTAARSLTQT